MLSGNPHNEAPGLRQFITLHVDGCAGLFWQFPPWNGKYYLYNRFTNPSMLVNITLLNVCYYMPTLIAATY